MLGKFFDKILDEEKEIEEEEKEEPKVEKRLNWKDLIGPLIIFFLALIPRLYFLYTHDPQNPGYAWYGDVYHHWQVAYLSKTVGFKHGFLRLWDFKGMEYFWGLLHPLASIFLFTITGSIDIALIRLLSIVPSSIVIVFIFLLVKRDFNSSVAWASALFLAFFPVTLFSDTLGMPEPLGLVLLFGGILAWPRYGVLTGFFWGLASMERTEYWLFSAALVFAALLDRRKEVKSGARISLFFSWLIVILFYMKYLAAWTGNYIYPIYWNFLASVVGLWFEKEKTTYWPYEYYSEVKIAGAFTFILATLAVVWLLKQGKRYYLWWLLGFLNLGLVGFMFSFAAYSRGYIDRFLVDRLFAWPYGFLGILLFIFLLYVLPNKFKFWHKLKLGWLIWLIVLTVSMLFWKPINYYFTLAQVPWSKAIKTAKRTAQFWDKKGKIAVPENRPDYVYALVRYHGVTGEQLVGEMFDVFYYLEDDPFINWEENWPKVEEWLKKEDISLFVVPKWREDYMDMLKRQPRDFKILEGKTLEEVPDPIMVQPAWRE